MSIILGINAFHPDSSACLIVDGRVKSAISEERLGLREKHTNAFPINAIEFVLQESRLNLSDVDHVAFAYDRSKNIKQKLMFCARNPKSASLMIKNYIKKLSNNGTTNAQFFADFSSAGEVKTQFHYVEHHLSHIASSLFVANFNQSTLGFSIDGSGDFVTSMMLHQEKGKLQMVKNYVPNSLGHFYSAMCQFIGFDKFGEEYKVMGLAPYGVDKYSSTLKKLVKVVGGKIHLNRDYFRVGAAFAEMSKNRSGDLSLGRLYTDRLVKLLGMPRTRNEPIEQFHKDIAKSTQVLFEQCMFDLLRFYKNTTGAKNLVMAGGCALNGVFNAKLKKKRIFENIFIQPAASDDGLSMGAALQVCANLGEIKQNNELFSPYLGQEFSEDVIEKYIKKSDNQYKYFSDYESLIDDAASEISGGSVIGWFQGKSEWGPRALGNRSILANPTIENMKEIINQKIKKRESFRPFAPSVLDEDVDELFEYYVKSPYMMDVVPFKEKYRELLPSVVHVDGTGRLQSVSPELNQMYYDLIKAVKQKTGYGVVLNTSFNENEPIVNAPSEALNCFNRTDLDALYMGHFKILRDENTRHA